MKHIVWSVGAALVGTLIGGSALAAEPAKPFEVKPLPFLPASKLKEDGASVALRAAASALKNSTAKNCRECGGKGTLLVRGGGAGLIQRKFAQDCGACNGGKVDNDPDKVVDAAVNLALAVARTPPAAQNFSNAMGEVQIALGDTILKHKVLLAPIQAKSANLLSQPTPPEGKPILVHCHYLGETNHPQNQGEKVYVVRQANKQQIILLAKAKQVDLPRVDGRNPPAVFVAGLIAGTVEVDVVERGTPEQVKAVVIERGFIVSPQQGSGIR